MNERIEKLSKEAQLYALDAMIKITDKEQALKVYSENYNTKFAELIVRECVKVADIADESKCEWIGGNILIHFGVEE
jgi:hypothetical protein